MSATPWKVIMGDTKGDEDEVWGIEDAEGNQIVETDMGAYPPTQEDAALIVRAVNAYDAMREALEQSRGAVDAWIKDAADDHDTTFVIYATRLLETITAALARAGKG